MDEQKLSSILFPRLSDAQIVEIAKFAQPKSYKDGEAIYEVGDRDFCFFVVKSGKMEIVDRSGEQNKTVTVAEEKQFTGDVALLTGNPAVVSAIALTEQASTMRQQLPKRRCAVVRRLLWSVERILRGRRPSFWLNTCRMSGC